MHMCYHHPKIQGIAMCKQCKLPICFHCMEGDYCPDCAQRRHYVQSVRPTPAMATRPKPRLIETPTRRSLTMELMIRRLQAQAFDADAASLHPRHRAMKRNPIKSKESLSYGLLMPGIAPLVKVTRSPISRLAALAVVAFGLGVFFAHPSRTYAEPAPAVAQAAPAPIVPVQPVVTERVHYKPIYIYVRETPAPSRVASLTMPTAARMRVSREAIRYAPAVAAVAVTAAPHVNVAFPTPGAVLRNEDRVRITIDQPERLQEVGITLDGAVIQAVPRAEGALEVKLDTSTVPNGPHTLQVIASDQAGGVVRSPEIPIAILN